MLKADFIFLETSESSSSVAIAANKYAHPRFCVDDRFLNHLMKGDRCSIPKIKEIFDDLIGALFFTTLDLFSGYWQIDLSEGFQEKTTFVWRFGTFLFEVMLFGLMNVPATFQSLMDQILKGCPFYEFVWKTW